MHPFNERLKRDAERRRKRFAALRKRGWSLARIGEAQKPKISRQRVAAVLGEGEARAGAVSP